MFLYVFHHVPPAFIPRDKLVKLLANNNNSSSRDKKMETLRLLQLLCVLRATVAVAGCPEKIAERDTETRSATWPTFCVNTLMRRRAGGVQGSVGGGGQLYASPRAA